MSNEIAFRLWCIPLKSNRCIGLGGAGAGGSGVPHVVWVFQINNFEQVHVMGVRGPHVVGGTPLVLVNCYSPHPNRQI